MPSRTEFDTYDEFTAGFVAGVIPQQFLDKVPDVMPLRNQEIEALVRITTTCVAVVYDSDIDIDLLAAAGQPAR